MTDNRPVLLLFGRTPRLGAGKTRLAQRIGALKALRFQQTQLTALCRRMGRDSRWQTRLVLTPAPLSRYHGLPVVAQRAGDLGQRMIHAMTTAPGTGPVVLVGTDIPALRPHHIAAALSQLRAADLVFGPAVDGGYWLIGWSRRRPLPRNALTSVRWSTANALQDSLASLGQQRRCVKTTLLADVDL